MMTVWQYEAGAGMQFSVEHLPSECPALDSIANTQTKQKETKPKTQNKKQKGRRAFGSDLRAMG